MLSAPLSNRKLAFEIPPKAENGEPEKRRHSEQ
jgi:hypothetical protein